jgi:hypothetical protein
MSINIIPTPSEREQTAFFTAAVDEARQLPNTTRYTTGPLYEDVTNAAKQVITEFSAAFPGYDISMLSPPGNREGSVMSPFEMTHDQRVELFELRRRKVELGRAAGRNALMQETSGQIIPEGTLAVPPYVDHEPGGSNMAYAWSGTPARMIATDLLGWVPNGILLARLMQRGPQRRVGTASYIRLFQTSTFQERTTGVAITDMDIVGASLGHIHRIATSVKQKIPYAKLYAIASLSEEYNSASPISDGRNDVVLLSADKTSVTVHNPYDYQGNGANRKLDRTDFIERWGVMLNNVHIVITK